MVNLYLRWGGLEGGDAPSSAGTSYQVTGSPLPAVWMWQNGPFKKLRKRRVSLKKAKKQTMAASAKAARCSSLCFPWNNLETSCAGIVLNDRPPTPPAPWRSYLDIDSGVEFQLFLLGRALIFRTEGSVPLGLKIILFRVILCICFPDGLVRQLVLSQRGTYQTSTNMEVSVSAWYQTIPKHSPPATTNPSIVARCWEVLCRIHAPVEMRI